MPPYHAAKFPDLHFTVEVLYFTLQPLDPLLNAVDVRVEDAEESAEHDQEETDSKQDLLANLKKTKMFQI